jgi:Uma2 family endonuclease
MTLTTRPMTLAEFLAYEDDQDYFYELENGELVAIPFESEINRRIAMFLVIYFSQHGVTADRLTMKTEMIVSGARASIRAPDLMVLSEELAAALVGATRSIIHIDMPPPDLVVEVVIPKQENRDYRYKRSEYAVRGIAEYWIVDPIEHKVTILEWVEGLYKEKVYVGEEKIVSAILASIDLTAN